MNPRIIANRYQIEEELGRGGMAVVYRALDLRLNRHVALKLLHPFLATQKESAERFIREAEAIAKLHHPNIVEIFDAGSDEESGSHYLVMELIEGPTLSAFIQQHPTKIPEIGLAMGCCLCDAVDHAHHAGIIHRDIKPENIMISADGTMKLMDFGIARVLDAERMTASGSLVGSPAHMPPEIIEGQPYGFTCDIFSMGTVIYYLLTNVLPFQGNTPMTVFKAILDNHYQKPSRVCLSVSKNIDKIVVQCLQTDPSTRYQTPSELKKDILPALALVHFDNYTEVLTRYFLDPEAFNQEMLPEVKKALNQSAKTAVREHRLPLALENLNCVLAYDPEDVEANALLQKLRTGDIIKKRVGIGLGALMLFIGLFFCLQWLFKPNTPNTNEITDQPHQIKLPDNSVTETEPDNPPIAPSITTPMEENDNVPILSGNIPHELWNMGRILANKSTDSDDKTSNPEPTTHDDQNIGQTPPDALIAANTKASREHEHGREIKPKPQKKSSDSNQPEKLSEQETSQPEKEIPPAEDSDKTAQTEKQPLVKVAQPVFPPDAYAVINGHRYNANSSGDIVMDLAPGTYQMVLSCEKRCVKHTETLHVEAGKNTNRDVISLDWMDASLNLVEPEGMNVYFMARRLDDRNQRIFHMASKTPNVVSGFNAFGKPIQLEVYAIPTSNTLKSYDINALEQAKYASTRVSLGPGEMRSIKF